jgi:hypothetical protein
MGLRCWGIHGTPKGEAVGRPLADVQDVNSNHDALRVAAAVDRDEIRGVTAQWALCRDTGRWETLRSLYAPGATMQTTWFEGSADEFVDRSMAAFNKGTKAQHFIGTSTVELRGKHAIAETRIVLLLRAPVGGVPADVTCYGRFYDFFARTPEWRIHRRIPIYEKDRIDAVDPSKTLNLDQKALARFAEGYRHLAYVQSLGGAKLTPGLIVPGSAEEQNLCGEGAAWLAQG